MSMCNAELIKKAAFLAGVTEEAHTFYHWKECGYMVKKGEHAAFTASIWKKGKVQVDKRTGERKEGKFFLAKGFFFTRSQVVPIVAGSSGLFLPVYDEAGHTQKVLVNRIANGFEVSFPNVAEKCVCDSMEIVQREIIDFCEWAGLRLAKEEEA